MGKMSFEDGGFADDYSYLNHRPTMDGDGNTTLVFAGYNFSRVFGLEFGYTKYGDVVVPLITQLN